MKFNRRYSHTNSHQWFVVVAIVMALISLMLVFSGFFNVSEAKAKRVLASNGFTDIKLTGHSFFGCSKDQPFSETFEAKDVRGYPASGVLCETWFGSVSVRVY